MVGLLVMQTRDGSLQLDAQETIVLALYFSFLVLAGASTLIQGGITVAIVAFKNEIALSLVMICLLLGFAGNRRFIAQRAICIGCFTRRFR
jgi:hypothetical protein